MLVWSWLAVGLALLSGFGPVFVLLALFAISLTAHRIWTRGGEFMDDERARREHEWCGPPPDAPEGWQEPEAGGGSNDGADAKP